MEQTTTTTGTSLPNENKRNDSFQWTSELQELYISDLENELRKNSLLPHLFRKKFVDSHTPKPQAETEEPYSEFVGRTKTNLYKEFIQKQPQAENKPEWEIVGYKRTHPVGEDEVFVKSGNVFMCGKEKQQEEYFLSHPYWCKIHSVKRLSDGITFSVGDEVYVQDDLEEGGIITNFYFSDNDKSLCARIDDGGYYFHALEKKKSKPQPQKEEQRIERVLGIDYLQEDNAAIHHYSFTSTKWIPKEKIKQAIEQVLNDEKVYEMFGTEFMMIPKADYQKYIKSLNSKQ